MYKSPFDVRRMSIYYGIPYSVHESYVTMEITLGDQVVFNQDLKVCHYQD